MPMKWRARLGMVVVIALALAALAAPTLNRPWHISGAVGVLVALAIVGVSNSLSFLVFRCPHCRARQLRSYGDWLFIGDLCWQCHQPLDGPARSPDLIDEELVAKLDPALAADMRRDRLILGELEASARTDPAAAARLERELSVQVEKLREWVAIVGREALSGEARARQDLARAEAQLAQCRSLRARNA